MNICVDCDRVILGPSEPVSGGESMSGARAATYAHPADSPDCRPLVPAKRIFREELRGEKPKRYP